MSRLIDDLNVLYAEFVAAIKLAVATGDVDLAERLAAEYDAQAVQLIAVHEGRTELIVAMREARYAFTDTPLRRLVRRLTRGEAA